MGKAEAARDAAIAAEDRVGDTAGTLTAFVQKTTLSSAGGVSRNIGANQAVRDIATIEGEITKIERQKGIAQQAVVALEREAERLKTEIPKLKEQVDDASGEALTLNTDAIDLEVEAEALRLQLDNFESLIAAEEENAATQDESAEVDDAEADRLAGLNPGEPRITSLREQAEAHRMEAAGYRAKADAIRSDPEYIMAKRDTAPKEAAATAKRAEADAKDAEVLRLQDAVAETESQAADAEDEAEEAKDYVKEIEAIKADLEASLAVWEGVVGPTTESDKAQLVLTLLEGAIDAPTNVVTDLNNESNHVFARASNKPAGTMTFEEIARNGVWGSAGGIFHTRSFLNPDDTVDDDTHADYDFRSNRNQGGTGLPQNHPVISLTGLEAANVVLQDRSTPSTLAYVRSTTRGSEYPVEHAQLNGIDGTLYCDRSGGCRTSDSGFFGEGWYFTPAVRSGRQSSLGGSDSAITRYEDSDNDGTYEAVSYLDYGMWLSGDDDNLVLHRRIDLVGPSNTGGLDFGTNTALAGSATYTGDAQGLSARTSGSRTASGHFTADVELTATFGEPASITGTIDNFRPAAGQGSDHVNRNWSIDLLSPVPGTPSGRVAGLVTNTNGIGKWGWTAYGDQNQRPAGFFGDFNAEFQDNGTTVGAAAGLYHVEKQ